MKSKNLLFLLCRFLDGGIDTVLVSLLNHLAESTQANITLAIAVGMGDLEVYRPQLHPRIKVVYAVEDGWLSALPRKRAYNRLHGLTKLIDEVLLNPVRNVMIGRSIQQLASEADVVVDFDCHAAQHLSKVKATKIAYYHFSFRKQLENAPRRAKRLEKKLSKYDKIVTVCRGMLEEGLDMFPSLSDKFTYVYNGYSLEALEKKAAIMPNGELIHKQYILAIERLEESQKDITTLLRAYARYRTITPMPIPLYVIGKGKSEAELKALAAELGIAEHVCFLGFISNPYPFIKNAQLMVHSAKFEGLGMVLIEALMLGKIIVATDCPVGPREVLNEGKAGLLVEVGNAEQLANAMHDALTDETVRQQLHSAIPLHAQVFTYKEIDKTLLPLMGL